MHAEPRQVEIEIDREPAREQRGVHVNVVEVELDEIARQALLAPFDHRLATGQVEDEGPALAQEPALGPARDGIDDDREIEHRRDLAERQQQAAAMQVAEETVAQNVAAEAHFEDQLVLDRARDRRERIGGVRLAVERELRVGAKSGRVPDVGGKGCEPRE